MPQPITENSQRIDLLARFPVTTTVVASPSAAAETIIANLPIPNFGDTQIVSGVLLQGWAAYTVGTSGASVQFRIRQTNISGTVIANTGALTGSQHGAGILSADDISGFDSGAGVAVYCMTMQVASAAAASTVSALCLTATVI